MKTHWPAALVICATLIGGAAASAEPLVTDVKALPDNDRKQVTITYRLSDPAANTVNVTMQVSSNNGTSWIVPANSFAANSAIGPGIRANGSFRTIVWLAGNDWNGNYSENMRVRIVAESQ